MESINIKAIQAEAQKSSQAKGVSTKDFGEAMGYASAASGPAITTSQMYGSDQSYAALAAAFSGVSQLSNISGGNAYAGIKYSGDYMSGSGMAGSSALGSSGSSSVIPGTEGFSQWDMINTMNQNNLQLLELQALMQSNMQAWNTKSNILSADHRARMAMIEKFTARG